MLCLGIESSCDDTSLALLENRRVLAEAASSQASLHALFGGVVPEVASREHARHMGVLCDHVFALAGKKPQQVDVVAVARGPGLLGSLLVGVAFAKAFALGVGADFIGVNHLHAHLMAAAMEHPFPFPALGLLVSGGHTHIYRMESCTEFVLLGKTLDDAAGEAFDKAGKMLGLPYPAGRHIDELSREGQVSPMLFPCPYLDNDTLDFSFSGLKTAMSVYLSKHDLPRCQWEIADGQVFVAGDRQRIADICASYSHALVKTLVTKFARAMALHPEIRTLVLAGGVAANSLLRAEMEKLAAGRNSKLYAPPLRLCADNGAMIGFLGALLHERGLRSSLSAEAIPRGRPFPDDLLPC